MPASCISGSQIRVDGLSVSSSETEVITRGHTFIKDKKSSQTSDSWRPVL